MTDSLSSKALEKLEILVVLYLSELGNLMQADPKDKWAFELTAQSRLQKLRKALGEAKERYEVPLSDHDVIKYGINQLASRARQFSSAVNSAEDKELATTLQRTLEAFISDGPGLQGTLPGLLSFARTYNK